MPLINTIDPLFTSERESESDTQTEEVGREIKKGAYLLLSILYLLLPLIRERNSRASNTQQRKPLKTWNRRSHEKACMCVYQSILYLFFIALKTVFREQTMK